jgi:hypothetical protein
VAALALLALAGCEPTQRRSDRLELQAQRQLATRQRILVTQPSGSVRVERTARVKGAIVALLRNTGSAPAADLPITVGVRSHGRTTYLNHRKGLDYFQTHAPAVAPGAEATWVFTLKRPAAGQPFAVVGGSPSPGVRLGTKLPSLAASAPALAGSTVSATVRNRSGVQQYGVAVYAYAQRSGRYVAAGRISIASLGAGRSATVRIPLTGDLSHAQVLVEASPTIFK